MVEKWPSQKGVKGDVKVIDEIRFSVFLFHVQVWLENHGDERGGLSKA